MTGTTQRPAWLAGELAAVLRRVHLALADATGAVLDASVDAEDRARTAVQTIADVRNTLEEDAAAFPSAPALLGPELGPVLLGTHVGTEIEGIADAAVQLVELAWMRRDRGPMPTRLLAPLRELADATLALVAAAASALAPDVAVRARRPDLGIVERDQQRLYAGMLAGGQPVDGADAADAVLAACRLVRAAHHAESVIAQAALLTGSAPRG